MTLFTAAVLLVAMTGGVVAQEANTTASTPTATATPTPESPEVAVSIGPLTDVLSWRYAGGTFYITIRADAPTLLTMAESPPPDAGSAGTVTFVRQRLAPGRNEVTVDVAPSGGEAVVILSTPASVNNGEAAFLRARTDDDLLDGPPSQDDVRDALVGAGLGTGIGALVVVYRRVKGFHRFARREA